jgi:hypothetical protein
VANATLAGTTAVTTGAGPINFNGTVESPGTAFDLTATSTGAIKFVGAVGDAANAALASLTTGTGPVALNGGSVTTTGNQTYGDPTSTVPGANAITLGANTKLTAATVNFNGVLTGGNHSLTIAGTGNAVFGRAKTATIDDKVSGLTTLSVAGTTTINTSAITSSGTQIYGDPNAAGATTTLITLGADATLSGTSIALNGKVAGSNHSLDIPTNVVFGRALTATIDDQVSGLTTLSVTSTTTINTSAISSSGSQTYGDPNAPGAGDNAITLATNAVGPLGGGVTLTASTVFFNGKVNKSSGTDRFLTVAANPASLATTRGNAVFGRTFGGVIDDQVSGVSVLTVNGTTTLNTSAITTSDSQTYGNATLAEAHDVTLKVDALTLTAAGTGKNITFAGLIDPDAAHKGALTVNASGDEIFQGRVGSKFALASLTTDAAGPTTGTAHFAVPGSVKTAPTVRTVNGQTYNDAVALDLSTVLTTLPSGTGNLLFKGTVDSASPAIQPDFTLTAAKGDVTFQGAVGIGAKFLGTVEVVTAANFTAAQSMLVTNLLQDAGSGTTTFKGTVAASGTVGIDLTANALVFDPGAGTIAATQSVATVRLNPQGGGATQKSGTLGAVNLLLQGSGTFGLGQTANFVNNLAANVAGAITLGDKGFLTIGTVGAVSGVTTGNNPLAINFGPNLAGGSFTILQPVNTGTATITAKADSGTATRFDVNAQLTAANSVDPTKAASFIGSNLGDTFTVLPSPYATIFVDGGLPNTHVGGDTLQLHLAQVRAKGAAANLIVKKINGESRDGRYTFAGFGDVSFQSIESFGGLSVVANAIQVSNVLFNLNIQPFITDLDPNGLKNTPIALGGTRNIPQPAINSFILSPAFAAPGQVFSAPRIAVGDVRGNGVPDIIIANGPGGPPLVTVLDSFALLSEKPLDAAKNRTIPTTLATSFFAYNPNFRGGVWVAAADLYHTGRAVIVTGEDAGGPAFDNKVKVFANVASNDPNNTDPNNPNASAKPIFQQVDAFDPYPGFTGGVRVAIGSNVDPVRGVYPILVTSPGFGTPEPVNVYPVLVNLATPGLPKGDASRYRTVPLLPIQPNPVQIWPYGTTFNGGVVVAVGDYNGRGTTNDIVTGPGTGVPQIKVFQNYGTRLLVNLPAIFTGYVPSVLPNGQPISLLVQAHDFNTKLPISSTLIELAQEGVSGVAFGAFNPSFGTRTIFVGSGIGSTALVSTLDVQDFLPDPMNAGNLFAVPVAMTVTPKRVMLARMVTPGGVNVSAQA